MATDLVELLGIGKPFPLSETLPPKSTTSRLGASNENSETNGMIVSRIHAELRAKHMSDEQISALLKFYSSDLGKSIIEATKDINREFSNWYQTLLRSSREQPELSALSLSTKEEPINNAPPERAKDIPACDFCRESPDNLNKLVAGSNVFICERCITMCNNVLKERGIVG